MANAPVSWGVLEFEGMEGRAGYSLVLDQIRETGYTGTELGDWGFLPTDPTELRSELGQRDLALLGAFVPVALADPRSHAAGREAALRVARLMVQAAGDQPFIVLADDNGRVPLRMQNAGRIRPEHGLSDSSWQTFGEGAVHDRRECMAERESQDSQSLRHLRLALFRFAESRYDCRTTAAEAESSRARSRLGFAPAARSPRAASTVDRRSSYVPTGRVDFCVSWRRNSWTVLAWVPR